MVAWYNSTTNRWVFFWPISINLLIILITTLQPSEILFWYMWICISDCFTHQAGIFGVKCFSTCLGLILVDSKSGEILMPNDLIALDFCSYKSTYFGGNATSWAGFDGLPASLIAYCKKSFSNIKKRLIKSKVTSQDATSKYGKICLFLRVLF